MATEQQYIGAGNTAANLAGGKKSTAGSILGDAAGGAATGAALGTIVPGIGNLVGGVVGGIGGLAEGVLGIDAHPGDKERRAKIADLAQQAKAGDPTAIAQLQEWATGQSVGGDSSRADEPNYTHQWAADALQQATGISVAPQDDTAQSKSYGSGGGTAPGVGGSANSASDWLNTALGIGNTVQGAADMTKANNLRQEALNEVQQNYNATQGLRAQGIGALEKAVAGQPDFSAIYSTPSDPFSQGRTVPGIGTPVPSAAAAESNAAMPGVTAPGVTAGTAAPGIGASTSPWAGSTPAPGGLAGAVGAAASRAGAGTTPPTAPQTAPGIGGGNGLLNPLVRPSGAPATAPGIGGPLPLARAA